jgi:hypothetical protein
VVVTLLFLACAPRGPSGPSDRTPFTPGSEDTGDVEPSPPTDLDADGWSETDGDCDDANPAVYPGAYDRPDDGIDADCADGDRTCDCLVLDAGTTVAETYEQIDTSAFRSLDLAYLLDTRPSAPMLETFAGSFPEIADALDTLVTTRTAGLATFDDYAVWPFGDASSGDKPFQLHAQQSDDLSLMQNALNGLQYLHGVDVPEAGMEALYQALTGTGYDQDCDATYDGSTDVKPFIADAADPFGGTAGQFYDVTDQSTGNVGGMGFRSDATVRVLVYATESDLRDPSAGYPSPGGCPGDAGAEDVAASALASGVYLVGIASQSTLPVDQMLELGDATGSVADLDGDGAADDPLVYQTNGSTTDVRDAILDALDAIRAETALRDVFASVTLEVRDDPLGIVFGTSPASYDNVAWEDLDTLSFSARYDTSAYGTKPVVGSVDFALVGDGFDLATIHVDVEIAPL